MGNGPKQEYFVYILLPMHESYPNLSLTLAKVQFYCIKHLAYPASNQSQSYLSLETLTKWLNFEEVDIVLCPIYSN